MSTRVVPEATEKMQALLAYFDEHPLLVDGPHWYALIRWAFLAKKQVGGLNGWARTNDGQQVECLQVHFDEADHINKVWEPGPRQMRWNPLGMRFFTDPTRHSDRRFNGMNTLASTEDVYVGYDKHFLQIVVFHKVDHEDEKV